MVRFLALAAAHSLCLGLFLGPTVGCSTSTLGTDLGIVEPGCRTPSACYLVGCDCNRGEVETMACKACDPRVQFCICDVAQLCLEGANLCVGKSPMVCGGLGARCLAAGSSCSSSTAGTAPQLVSNGATLEPHCQYTDDVCCPGVVVDLGAPD